MGNKGIEGMTIAELLKGYHERRFSVREVVQSYLQRISSLDHGIGAFITVCSETALKKAEELDGRIGRGEDIGLLGGIPVAVKDNICTENIRTTCASRMLEDFIPPYDATVVRRLKDAGALIIGKTNMDEFAMGTATGTSAFGRTNNPWDLSKVPGGSSGGSAAALAACFAPLALGSDTGGSIRQPAAFCGVVGLKPTYGAVSRYGLIALASSLDQIGSLTRTVEDCELAFQIMKGQDPNDATGISYDTKADYVKDLERGVQGLRIGVPVECLRQLDEEILQSVQKAAKLYEEAGARVEMFSLPEMDHCLPAYSVISSVEAAVNLARYDGIRCGNGTEGFDNKGFDELIRKSRSDGFGREVKRRILLGTCITMSEDFLSCYQNAEKIRRSIKYILHKVFQSYDLILLPTSHVLPFDHYQDERYNQDALRPDRFTSMANLAGTPALSMPGGFSRSGLPVGLQLMGNYMAEDKIFRAAYCLEQRLGISSLHPSLGGMEQDA